MIQSKVCTKCGQEKHIGFFHIDRSQTDGRRSCCRECWNAYRREYRETHHSKIKAYKSKEWARIAARRLIDPEFAEKSRQIAQRNFAKYRFSITLEMYEEIMASADVCMLCGVQFKQTKKCLDHCHITGRIRGVLCNNCNTFLGKGGDTVEPFEKAIRYLRSPPLNIAPVFSKNRNQQ